MGEATKTTLGDLAKAGHLEFGDGYRTKRAEHGKPGIPILRVAEVLDGKILPALEDYVSDAYRDSMGQKISQPGDVVLTTKGTVGRVAIMPSNSPEFVYSPQLCYFRLRPGSPLLARYLYYWFKSEQFWSQARSRKSQTDMADYLNLADIRSLEISLPELREQQAVTSVLGALDDKIAVNERIAGVAEQLAAALASHTMWDTTTPLREIVDQTRDQVIPESINAKLIAHYSLPSFDASRLPETVEPWRIKSGKFQVVGAAVLLSKLNPSIPRVWNVDPSPSMPALASTEFLVLKPKAGITTHEVWAVCSQPEFFEELVGKATGTSNSHQRVRPADILSTEVVDPRSMTDVVRGQIASLSRKAMRVRVESQVLAQLRDTLLPKLISGELRVRDAEKAVEEAL